MSNLFREYCGGERVYCPHEFRLALRFVHCRIGGSIDDDIGSESADALTNACSGAYVQRAEIGRTNLRKLRKQRIEITANLSIYPCQEDFGSRDIRFYCLRS